MAEYERARKEREKAEEERDKREEERREREAARKKEEKERERREQEQKEQEKREKERLERERMEKRERRRFREEPEQQEEEEEEKEEQRKDDMSNSKVILPLLEMHARDACRACEIPGLISGLKFGNSLIHTGYELPEIGTDSRFPVTYDAEYRYLKSNLRCGIEHRVEILFQIIIKIRVCYQFPMRLKSEQISFVPVQLTSLFTRKNCRLHIRK
jgi:hypothetical protein